MFGGSHPQLSAEEYKALAGIWRLQLDLYEGRRSFAMSLHLAAPQVSAAGDMEFGDVFVVEDALYDELPSARWCASRTVHAGEVGDDQLCVSLQMGSLCLDGQGERAGLRCSAFAGVVLEGGEHTPRTVGQFSLGLVLPMKTDAARLEDNYRQRIVEHAPFAGDVTALLDFMDEEELGSEGSEASEARSEEARDGLSMEEAAKRAWLSRLSVPTWGGSGPPPRASTFRSPP